MSVSYTLRLPDDLKRLLDQEAYQTSQSLASVIITALWNHLDRTPEPGQRKPAAPPPVNIDALRALCAGKLTGPDYVAAPSPFPDWQPMAVQMCPYSEYDHETGETMGCGLARHSLKQKHGAWRRL